LFSLQIKDQIHVHKNCADIIIICLRFSKFEDFGDEKIQSFGALENVFLSFVQSWRRVLLNAA